MFNFLFILWIFFLKFVIIICLKRVEKIFFNLLVSMKRSLLDFKFFFKCLKNSILEKIEVVFVVVKGVFMFNMFCFLDNFWWIICLNL